MAKHFHCDILAFEKIENSMYVGATTVQIIGYLDEQEAIERAKKVVIRPGYHLNKVWECNTCGIQKGQLETMEMLRKILKDNENDHGN